MIVAEHVTKYYDARPVVSDISFTIAAGEVIGLLGLNGAGKTTTLRILSGLLVPSSGRVFVAGLDMRDYPEAARGRLGFLPEVPPLYPEMRVEEFLTFAAHIKGLRKGVRAAVDEAIEATDLAGVRQQRIATLSHGYQRRVGIAQAVVHRPALILLDEPTSGLDPLQIVQMRKLILSLRTRHTIVVSSHILGEIHQLCDRIFVLQDGRIAAEGTEEQLAQKVSAQVMVAVEVRGTREAFALALGKLPAARSHTIVREQGDLLEAAVELSDDRREELARLLVQDGLGLLRLERTRLELEGIFLKLTGAPSVPAESAISPS
jgi:ABC-2 type transport system ATP-binding protein